MKLWHGKELLLQRADKTAVLLFKILDTTSAVLLMK